jgi:hypothetical protein
MSNIFILVKCKNFLPETVSSKIAPYAIKYNFLWIGGNSIGNYHINQYKGTILNIKLFVKEVNNILQIAKNKNKIKCYSIIFEKNKSYSYLEKPSEHDFSIYKCNMPNLPEKNTQKIIFSLKTTYLLKVISKLKKTKNRYHLPLLLLKKIKDHPTNVKSNVFITIGENSIVLYGENKLSLKYTKLWLIRLSKLLHKSSCF